VAIGADKRARLSIQPIIIENNNGGHRTGGKLSIRRTSIIGVWIKSVKGVNKYEKIDKRGRI
jgi:hypothetical protein